MNKRNQGFSSKRSSVPASSNVGKEECQGHSSSGHRIARIVQRQAMDSIRKKSITYETAIENHEAAAITTDKFSFKTSQASPNGMVSGPHNNGEDCENVADTVYGSSDSMSENKTPNHFFASSSKGLNLVVALPPIEKEERIPQSTHHCKHRSFYYSAPCSNSILVDKHGHNSTEIPSMGVDMATLYIKAPYSLTGTENSGLENCTASDTTALSSRPSSFVSIRSLGNKVTPQELANASFWPKTRNTCLTGTSGDLIVNSNKKNPELEHSVKIDSKQNSTTETEEQQNVPAWTQLSRNSDTHELELEKVPVDTVATKEGTRYGEKMSTCFARQTLAKMSTPYAQSDVRLTGISIDGNLKLPNSQSPEALANGIGPVVKNDGSESSKRKATQNSGSITNASIDDMYATLQFLQKQRDEHHHKLRILQDRSAECDLYIQKLLTEGKITQKVTKVLERYEGSTSYMIEDANSSCYGERRQTMNIKRRKLIEAILLCNKCKELDRICRESNWILPTYIVLPSAEDDMYKARIYLTGWDGSMIVDGDLQTTPREARESAAAKMLHQLHQKAIEIQTERSMGTYDTTLT